MTEPADPSKRAETGGRLVVRQYCQIESSSVGNSLLRSLEPQALRLLLPLMSRVECRKGQRLSSGSDGHPFVYFPETVIICIASPPRNTGIGLIGREGVFGWAGLMGGRQTPYCGRVILQTGTAIAISGERLRAVSMVCPSLILALVTFMQNFTLQMGRTVLFSLHDPTVMRLGKWLMMLHDRAADDELSITHRELAGLLNLRRASVTDSLHVLEGEGALRNTRGKIVIGDRRKLEACARRRGGAAASYEDGAALRPPMQPPLASTEPATLSPAFAEARRASKQTTNAVSNP